MLRLKNYTRFFSTTTMNLDKIIYAPETYQYTKSELLETNINTNPFEQFHQWFQEAKDQEEPIPESVTFSTARLPSGRVSSRIVLLKELDHEGFIVYSNWGTSKKLKDFQTNKYASLTFFWKSLQRQVRVEGQMVPVEYVRANEYFKTRPVGSQIGAWASPQSSKIESRDQLDKFVQEKQEQFQDEAGNINESNIKCPEFWGGMKIIPLEIEFWQGRNNRLHDRLTFTRENTDSSWELNRLAP